MECRPSRVKLLGLLGLTGLMVAMSYSLTTLHDVLSRSVGWVALVFFGLCLIAEGVMFFRTGPQVIINDEGIEDRRMKIGVIRWEDILSLRIDKVESTKFLCIELVDPEKYLSRLPQRGRWLVTVAERMGFPGVTIAFVGLSPGIQEVWAYLLARDREPGGLSGASPPGA